MQPSAADIPLTRFYLHLLSVNLEEIIACIYHQLQAGKGLTLTSALWFRVWWEFYLTLL